MSPGWWQKCRKAHGTAWVSRGLGSEQTGCHLHLTLLEKVKSHHQTQIYKLKKYFLPFQCEELQSNQVKGMDTRRGYELRPLLQSALRKYWNASTESERYPHELYCGEYGLWIHWFKTISRIYIQQEWCVILHSVKILFSSLSSISYIVNYV